MVPPITGPFNESIEVDTKEKAELALEDVSEEEGKILLAVLNEKFGEKLKSKEDKEINNEHLLNKPNMTEKDKINMEKSIKFLVDNGMDSPKNLKKLEAINYGTNYIEIGGVKRSRENLKAEPNNKNIFKHGDEVYFKFDTLKEQNELLAKQGMKIPGKDDFATSLKALPGEFEKDDWYTGGNILGNILDLSLSGSYNGDGYLLNRDENGHVRSASERGTGYNMAWFYNFSESEGILDCGENDSARVIRPVLK